jgi:phage portal protein BeeE
MRLLGRARQAPAPPHAASRSLGQIQFPSDPMLRVSREAAMSLSVVANARNVIVGIASQLSVDRKRGDELLDPGTILTQPDPDQTWPETLGLTVDQLIFYGEAYWLVVRRDSEGFPSRARVLPYGATAPRLDLDWSKYTRIIEYSIAGVIHFSMPSLGVLRDSAALLLDSLTLAAAASRFTSVPLPAGVLYNEGQEVGEDDAKAIVAGFDAAREAGETAFLQSMRYERTALNAADLQLVEALAVMDTRLARAMNVPVSMVGASPTGQAHAQLYANVVAALTQLVQQAIAPYLRVIEETFTGQQVTPRGQTVEFDTEDWLRFAQIAGAPTTGAPAGPVPIGEAP